MLRLLLLLLGFLTFPVSHSHVLLDLFLSADSRIFPTVAFPPFRNSDHVVVVPISIDFAWTQKKFGCFRSTAYNYSSVNWDVLRNYLINVSWKDNFKIGTLAAAAKFCINPSLSKSLALSTFGRLLIMFSTKANLLYFLYLVALRCCFLHLHLKSK